MSSRVCDDDNPVIFRVANERCLLMGPFRVDEVTVSHTRADGTGSDEHAQLVVRQAQRFAVLLYAPADDTFILFDKVRYTTASRGARKGILLETIAHDCSCPGSDEEFITGIIKSETVYRVTSLELVATYFSAPATTNELVWLYFAKVSRTAHSRQPREALSNDSAVTLSRDNFFRMLDAGAFEDPTIIISGQWALARLGRRAGIALPRLADHLDDGAPMHSGREEPHNVPYRAFRSSRLQRMPLLGRWLSRNRRWEVSPDHPEGDFDNWRPPPLRYAWESFHPLVRRTDWASRRSWDTPCLVKAYVLCMLSELAYEFISQRELDDTRRLKVVPCESYQRSLSMRNVISQSFWRSIADGEGDGLRVRTFEGVLFHTMVIKGPNVVFVVLRGTKPYFLNDWRINLQALMTSVGADETCLFHSGFLHEAVRCARLVLAAVGSSAASADIPIYVTGHSLGGALANVMYTLYSGDRGRAIFGVPHETRLKIACAYAFASPRYGNDGTIGVGALPVIRSGRHVLRPPFNFRDVRDPVPHLPPKLMGYDDPHCEYDVAGRNLKGRWSPGRLLPSLAAHSISRLRRGIARSIALPPVRDLLPREIAERERVLSRI